MKQNKTRQITQLILGALFLPMIAIGFFWPFLGAAFILFCMLAGIITGFFNGRKWCDSSCPRGDFLESYLGKISANKNLPDWFYSYKFRLFAMALLFSFLFTNIYLAWPSQQAVAFAFVKTLIASTIIAIILGVFSFSRAWCMVCPVGTASSLASRKKNQLFIDKTKCSSCNLCQKSCPIKLNPAQDKNRGRLQSKDCLSCGSCVLNCPKKALINF